MKENVLDFLKFLFYVLLCLGLGSISLFFAFTMICNIDTFTQEHTERDVGIGVVIFLLCGIYLVCTLIKNIIRTFRLQKNDILYKGRNFFDLFLDCASNNL